MSKTNTEKMAPETQTPEMTNGMKLDVRVRPIAPMGNLLAFANVTIGGCFKIDGFRICSSEKGLYVNMPATQDTQEQLAEQLGVAANTIARIETGNRGISIDLAIELVVRFETTLDYIFLGRE